MRNLRYQDSLNNLRNIAFSVAVFSMLGLFLAAVVLPGVAAAHGVDADGDLYSEEDGDCNDDDATIFPGAVEIPDDGIDQNCDGAESSGIDPALLIGVIAGVIVALAAVGWYVWRRMNAKKQTQPTRRRRR